MLPSQPKNSVVAVNLSTAIAASGTTNPALIQRYVNELCNVTFFRSGVTEEQRSIALNALLEAAESLGPKDIIEGQLIGQMLTAHTAAMECIRRSNLAEQTELGRDMALKHATNLMNLYIGQMKALNRYRGLGDQKVIIEHVNIAPGGQAIVGNIASSPTKFSAAAPEPLAIERSQDLPLPGNKNLNAKQPVRSKTKKQ